MPQLILSRGTTYRTNILRRILPNVELGPYFLIVSLVIFVSLITVITLVFSTRQVTKGYVLNKLQAEHQDLIRDSEKNDLLVSEVRSLNFIQQSSKVRSMVTTAGKIAYVNGETALAKK